MTDIEDVIDIQDVIKKYIKDDKELEVIDSYQRQFARLHSFPTCLGRAIDAYDRGRFIDPIYRTKMEKILKNIGSYLGPNSPGKEEDLADIANEIRHLRMDLLEAGDEAKNTQKNVLEVFYFLSMAFPPPLEHVHRRKP